MSNGNNSAVQALIQKRDEIKAEQIRVNAQFDADILQIETAIETLAGKKVWELPTTERFDDENPNYIRQSVEEI